MYPGTSVSADSSERREHGGPKPVEPLDQRGDRASQVEAELGLREIVTAPPGGQLPSQLADLVAEQPLDRGVDVLVVEGRRRVGGEHVGHPVESLEHPLKLARLQNPRPGQRARIGLVDADLLRMQPPVEVDGSPQPVERVRRRRGEPPAPELHDSSPGASTPERCRIALGKTEEADEPLRIRLPVHLVGAEGREILPIEGLGTLASHGLGDAPVEADPHRPGRVPVRLAEEGVEGLAKRGEPLAVVDELRVPERHGGGEMVGRPVQGEALERRLRLVEDRAARGLVDAAGLHPDEPVLDDVHPADAVPGPRLVQPGEQGGRPEPLAADGDRDAALETDVDGLGLGRGLVGVPGDAVETGGRSVPGILEILSLVAQVQQVLVAAVEVAGLLLDRHPVARGVGEGVLPGADVPKTPGGDDLEIGSEGMKRELETHLVVALAGATVGHGVGAFLPGDVHLVLRDRRTGERGAEQVAALVDGARPHRREDVAADELVAQVFDEHRGCPGSDGLVRSCLKVLVLAHVGHDRENLGVVVFLEPRDGAGGVESAGIGESNTFWHGGTNRNPAVRMGETAAGRLNTEQRAGRAAGRGAENTVS